MLTDIGATYLPYLCANVAAVRAGQRRFDADIDGVLYLRVLDPYKASYGVEDPEFAITQLAQTTMRSEIGKINLDTLFRERENLNLGIVQAINTAAGKQTLLKLSKK